MSHFKARPRVFNQLDYDECDLKAFEQAKKDFSHFYLHKPQVEDYGIDVLAWESESAMKQGLAPLFGLELEVKKTPSWNGEEYPYPSVHFLSRKTRLMSLPCVPFWVLYNRDFSKSLILPISYVLHGKIEILNHLSKTEVECVYDVPLQRCVFGRSNMENFILQYYASIAEVDQCDLFMHLRPYMEMVNRLNQRLAGLLQAS